HGRHLIQRLQEAQPHYLNVSGRAAIRFDGKDDHLGYTGPKQAVDDFTVFLVASPHSNAGGFRALLAAHETGKNDFTTGLNIDLGLTATTDFGQLSVEGRGFAGPRNLMDRAAPFGAFPVIAITSSAGESGVKLFINRTPNGQRDRETGPLRIDNLS